MKRSGLAGAALAMFMTIAPATGHAVTVIGDLHDSFWEFGDRPSDAGILPASTGGTRTAPAYLDLRFSSGPAPTGARGFARGNGGGWFGSGPAATDTTVMTPDQTGIFGGLNMRGGAPRGPGRRGAGMGFSFLVNDLQGGPEDDGTSAPCSAAIVFCANPATPAFYEGTGSAGVTEEASANEVVDAVAVPLPGALGLMLMGLVGMGAMTRRRTLT